MDKTYQPSDIEARIYAEWLKTNAFVSQSTSPSKFCIMLPPPNVTGNLHMGHAFQQTLMDILIRTHRMQGDDVLWQVGTDHAGIATQMVVENQLHKEDKTRYDLGRDAFVKRVWDWKEASGHTIIQQMQRVGASADWSRERFTMDEGLSDAVQHAFITLYEDGLIYRGVRLVNWDPHFKTAVSDLEVIHSEEQGFLYHIRYSDDIVVATTRPETLLGDVAVAVHPKDKRYQHLIGKTLRLPLSERDIPIIADESVDQAFGTGCVKITPAHDFNDYEMGKRHTLPMPSIFTLDGKINDTAPEAYRGLDRFAARKKILQDLEAKGLLIDKKPHTLNIPRNERGNTILEPMLTEQWYVKMAPLAEPAIQAVQKGDTQFVPQEWQNTYFRWLENIQDWCISRQLWWGHRIPAWYDDAGHIYVGRDEADVRKKHELAASVALRQDEDVLDTWFSSALWPFSTLGWPHTPSSPFYPTSVLVTGFDIIFFWVARMIMFGLYFTKQVPFKTVYIHGLIRDHEGQKMSKSKGNGLDPVDLIDGIDLNSLINKRVAGLMQESLKPKVIKATEKQFPEGINAFGTDALRFTFAAMASPTRDIHFDVKRLEGYRNFCNKLWNATRFVLMNVEGEECSIRTPMMDQGDVEAALRGDASICENIHNYFDARLQHTINSIHDAIANYRFDLMAQAVYDFFWNDYCDWYLEFCKVILNEPSLSLDLKCHTRYSLLSMLEKVVRLLHPIIPFITEEIWQTLRQPLGLTAKSIIDQPYPAAAPQSAALQELTPWLQELVIKIRTIRADKNVHPSKMLPLYFDGTLDIPIKAAMLFLKPMAKVSQCLEMDEAQYATSQRFTMDRNHQLCTFHLGDVIDTATEKARIDKEISKISDEMTRLTGKLQNSDFVDKAPAEIVKKERARLADLDIKRGLLQKDLRFLQ